MRLAVGLWQELLELAFTHILTLFFIFENNIRGAVHGRGLRYLETPACSA